MEQRTLCDGGELISAIGLGAWPLGGGMGHIDKKVAINVTRSAIDQGITFIDTAQMYKDSEAVLGEALQDGYRERCFLATKVSRDFSAQGIKQALENSLTQMRVDFVDLYQIHRWDDRYPLDETMNTLAQLQRDGKTRYIGVSNYNAAQMAEALNITPFHTNQIAYSLFERGIEAEDILYCEKHGIGILAHSVLAKGLLTGKYTPDYQFPPDDERSKFEQFRNPSFERYLNIAEQLRTVANDLNLTMVQLSLVWVLHKPVIRTALVGAKSTQQVDEYLGALNVRLSEADLSRIGEILQTLHGVEPM